MAYGGMYDFHVFMRTKGKLFQAPISFFRKDKALYFPNFTTRTLEDKTVELMDVLSKNKITILRVVSTESGVETTEDYFKVPKSEENYLTEAGLKQLHQEFPNTQIVQLTLSDRWSKHFVHTFVTPSKLRKTLPEELHSRYLVAFRDKVLDRDSRERLLITNTYSGYVYLIDDQFKIRWAGSGLPEPKEVSGMWKAVAGLERESGLKIASRKK
ncbi:unnamed protein product [Ambrosiozyma monospora]|uniref:Unnamed protein product n=1 Tax=Ambrosiozyma monospora TaxID=43982 RepID=A0ACB5U1X4_AMBMO|nr:unnamed protein product [Ambrosiozyma monospora]